MSAALSSVVRKYEAAMAAGGVVWGSLDCLHFGLEAAAACGRRDLRPLIPSYSNQLGAIRALRRMGYGCLMDALDAHATPVNGARALAGDIALLPQAPLDCVGVVVGADALFLAPDGFLRVPARGLFVWRPG